MQPLPKEIKKHRLVGYDVARALAVFGMVLVNYRTSMNANQGHEWLLIFSSAFAGRASALFVVLAGVGLSLMTEKARLSQTSEQLRVQRILIVKRAGLLIALGLIYVPIWPADILHFYGAYFLLAALLFNLSNRWLWVWMAMFIGGFVILLGYFDYDQGWQWESLTYVDFWSGAGMLRHLLFNGFHPVFPWCAFLVLGLWLARQPIQNSQTRKRLMLYAGSLWLITEAVSVSLIFLIQNLGLSAQESQELILLVDTEVIPPTPLYMLSAGSLAVLVSVACLAISEKFSQHLWVKLLTRTGQLSLSLYVAHVLIGLGLLESIGRLENQSIEFSLLCSLIFCLVAVVFAQLWLSRFRQGPLEWLFRVLSR